jgi:futalosine hydrolase
MPSPVLIVAATEAELCGHDGLVCGVGPVEAAATTARALALGASFGAVLHVGLAGATGLAPGSFVVGSQSLYADLSAEWPVVDRLEPDARLIAGVLGELPGAALLPIATSAAVTRACNTVSQGRIVVEAMEGFGVLRAAALAGRPAVEVRVISNELGEEDRGRWAIGPALEALEGALPSLLDGVGRAHERFDSRRPPG